MKKLLLAFAAAFCSLPVSAGSWEQLYGDILEKYGRFEEMISDMYVFQETSAPEHGVTSLVELYTKNDKFRVEVVIKSYDVEEPAGRTYIISNGSGAWMISDSVGRKKLTEEERLKYQPEKNWWNYLSGNGRVSGAERINGFDCHIIEFGGGSLFRRIWLERDNLILVKGETILSDETAILEYSDFRKVMEEWYYPYVTNLYLDDVLFSVSIMREMNINGGISDDYFEPGSIWLETGGVRMDKLNDMIKKKEAAGDDTGRL